MKNSARVILSDNEKIHQKSRGFAEVQAKYHEEFASHKGLPVSILDEEDKGIIRLYSRNQTPFNCYLKQGISIDSGINGNAKKFENALSKMANATEISYRGYGIPKGAWDNLSPGELVTNDVFMSTSLSISYAKTFTERFSQGREGVMLKVMGRTGKNISLLSHFQGKSGESEILFSPNSTFNIMAIKKHRKINYAIVREVKNNPDQKRSIYDGRLLQPPIHESAWTPMS
ncbi:ADP-ribosyltransferase [Proteus columbae]|uniref:ADP-ribosyltransferase n=1 Tax=Proteus columbae TaxID=1987580 RepID=UPI001E6045DD|nr:ADP-ribosyltransferase [Proteus columbae]